MSKSKNVMPSNVASVGYGNAYVIYMDTPSQIEGKILTILETAGLPEKQEEAMKGLIRGAIWNTIHDNSVFISDTRHNEIREAYWKMRKEAGDDVPMSAV